MLTVVELKKASKRRMLELYDIVPTILHSMGLPLPGKFDGCVLDELFMENKQVEQRPLEEFNGTESSLVRSKLKKLLET